MLFKHTVMKNIEIAEAANEISIEMKTNCNLEESIFFDIKKPYPVTGITQEINHFDDLPFNDIFFIIEDIVTTAVVKSWLTRIKKEKNKITITSFLKEKGTKEFWLTNIIEVSPQGSITKVIYPTQTSYEVERIKNLQITWPRTIEESQRMSSNVTIKCIKLFLYIYRKLISSHKPTIVIPNNKELKQRGISTKLKEKYSTWTLDLTKPKPAIIESKGGTHASPREHVRRGHWRTRNNKRTWIQATVICKDSPRGKVTKDYSI